MSVCPTGAGFALDGLVRFANVAQQREVRQTRLNAEKRVHRASYFPRPLCVIAVRSKSNLKGFDNV
jgi:hypothetical protein